ncbi:YdcF family protein [Methylovulum psychrotolerans]|uniref:YdcF family protein n=1 Tax=Methylovulum psychrotolerans TaxID=1704499 RepID=UPI001BFF8EB3|nr:YdcF family protein [Methylovulum psychrotolerans]MBT9096870.1 YdcF family protein [Methylovulum psychrotolerans]
MAIGLLSVGGMLSLAWQIYAYSASSSPVATDVAIVLGAAVWNGKPSPVFQERIQHGIDLYQSGRVRYLIFTGGIGKGGSTAEAEVARLYAIGKGLPAEKLLTETVSHITYGNLYEACQVMKVFKFRNALLVSHPLHMKRAIKIAEDIGIKAYPSPTPTTRYRSWRTKSGALAYEVLFYMVHVGSYAIGLVDKCAA